MFQAKSKEDKSKNTPPITIFQPEEVLGAGTDELDHRFDEMGADVKQKHMKCMQLEDNALQPYLEKAQLGKWARAVLDLAKEDFMRGVDSDTDDGERKRLGALKLREIEERIAESSVEKSLPLKLHSKKSVAKFSHSRR